MAQVDYFLKIDGIDGESADKTHKKDIDLESFSWGVAQGGTFGSGGGGGAGKAQFSDFTFMMKVNCASSKLFLACATGEHIKKGVLVCRKAGTQQQEFLKVTMTDLLVSSFQTSGSGSGDVLPMESISLNFAKVEWEYKEQKPDGTLGGAIKAGYDVKAQAKV
jgi:type VI secretion system secreted protein Hcp